MSRTDNEQEFVLGNRQLLSAFFVVVLLLAVFFVMGYIVGNNSKSENAAKRPAQVEPAPSSASGSPDSETNRASAVQPEAKPETTQPAIDRPAETPVEEARPLRQRRPPDRSAPEAEAPPSKAAVKVESAPGHTYLQVSAVKRPAADSIVKTLKDKGFPALLGESSKPELFRVLVGPYAETERLSKAKSDLKAMGFDAVVTPGSK